jgi:ribose transport system substrate-binding protein
MSITPLPSFVRKFVRERGIGRLACVSVVSALCAGVAVGASAVTATASAPTLATKLATADEGPHKFQLPGPAFDALKAKGKTAWMIGENLTTPFNGLVAKGWQEGLALAGVKTKLFDSKGEISEMARGIDLAIAAHASVILWAGVKFQLLAPQLAAAYHAHIPVIDMLSVSPGEIPAHVPKGVVAFASHSYSDAGRMMADYIGSQSKGQHPQIGFITSSDVGIQAGQEGNAFSAELRKVCPGCSLVTSDVPTAQWSTQLSTVTSSLIQSHPDMKYLVPLFDGEALYMIPAVHAAGAESKVQIVSFNGTPALLSDLKSKNVMGADVGVVNLAEGWGIADQTLRVLTGTKPVPNINAIERLFTQSNVGSINMKAQESTWYGPNNFPAIYKKLWKLG